MKTENDITKFTQALNEGNIHYCPKCKKKQPIELTMFNPDLDEEADLIVCLVCKEPIDFIQNM